MTSSSNRRRNPDEPSTANLIAEHLLGLRQELESVGDTLSDIRTDIQWAVHNLIDDIRNGQTPADPVGCGAYAPCRTASEARVRLRTANQVIVDLLLSKQLDSATADAQTNAAVEKAIAFLKDVRSPDNMPNPITNERHTSERSNGFLF